MLSFLSGLVLTVQLHREKQRCEISTFLLSRSLSCEKSERVLLNLPWKVLKSLFCPFPAFHPEGPVEPGGSKQVRGFGSCIFVTVNPAPGPPGQPVHLWVVTSMILPLPTVKLWLPAELAELLPADGKWEQHDFPLPIDVLSSTETDSRVFKINLRHKDCKMMATKILGKTEEAVGWCAVKHLMCEHFCANPEEFV